MKPVYEVRAKGGEWVAAFAELKHAETFTMWTHLEVWRVDFPPGADVEARRAELWAMGATVVI